MKTKDEIKDRLRVAKVSRTNYRPPKTGCENPHQRVVEILEWVLTKMEAK